MGRFCFKVLMILGLFILPLQGYEKPSHLSESVWNRVSPYLISETDPVKAKLDRIFSDSRAILNWKQLKKAGFDAKKPRKWTHLIVAKHPSFPGYIFKLYLDVQHFYKQMPEYEIWIQRIVGANLIRGEIARLNVGHLFKVPHKWIYALPANPAPPKEFARKNFILVEEDMGLLSHKNNKESWKSLAVTKETLDALYTILRRVGLRDGVKPDNLPFSTDGRIAFVDTQSVHQWPVPYKNLVSYLSSPMKDYWKDLTRRY